MPLVQFDYDYFEYDTPNKRTAKAAPRSSVGKKSTVKRTSTTKKVATKKKTTSKTSLSSAKVSETRKTNRASIRAVVNEGSKTTSRKNNSKNLEVPNIVSKKQIQKPKEMSLKNAEVMSKPKAKNKVKKKASVIQNIGLSLFGFSVLFLICYRSSVINESFNELNSMKSELGKVNIINAQIESDIQTRTDLSNIESYAKYQLGMQKPKDSQIQKVVIEKKDKIATPVVITEDVKESFWDKFVKDIVNILD